jgi:DNA-directed RNA polymerase subunit M/transcription elongation factor TFIIS
MLHSHLSTLYPPNAQLTAIVCPTCSNMLRVSKVPPGDPTTEDAVGQNRFECLTCPYHFVINKRYYERKYLKKKEVEDILGGKGAWDNVDKTEGMLHYITCTQRHNTAQFGERSYIGRVWLTRKQCNVQTRSAGITKHTGTSCRLGVLTSL